MFTYAKAAILACSLAVVLVLVPACCHAFAAATDKVSLEFERIEFPEHRPGVDEAGADLEAVIDDRQKATVEGLLQALRASPTIGVKVTGFADKHEGSVAECDSLSLRRARLVFDWLIRNGIPAARLKGPFGESTAFPLDDGDTKEGRAANRRVQLEPYSMQSSARADEVSPR